MTTSGAVDSGLSETWDFVWNESGVGANTEVPYPWPVSIDGRPFAVDLLHYQWQLPDMVRQAIDFSAQPGEQSFDTGGVWLRSSGDWRIGTGQEYQDVSDSSQQMFAASLGIDPWTARQIKLLPDTELVRASSKQLFKLLPFGEYLYLVDGDLFRTSNPQDAIPTFTSISGGAPGQIYDITTDGSLLYLATGAGIYTHDPATLTMAPFGGAASTTIANVLQWTNGWLLCGVGNTLSSIDAAGTLTTVMTHPGTTFTWSAIVGAPPAIYAAGKGIDLVEIMSIQLDPTTAALAPPVHAGELPRGEGGVSLAYYGSVLLIGTSLGFRIGNINGDSAATLDIGPLIPTVNGVLSAYGDSKFVYFSWDDYDSTHTGIGRADLSNFRARSQPAYATDLMAVAQGTVSSVCRFQGHTYFTVEPDESTAGSGLWREQFGGNVVPSGTIRLGKHEWGTFEPKAFLGLQLTTLPLQGSVDAAIIDDTGTVTSLGTLSSQGSTCIEQLLGAGYGPLSTFFDIELTLNRPTL